MVWPYVMTSLTAAIVSALWRTGKTNTEHVNLNYVRIGEAHNQPQPRCTILHLSDLHLELNSISPERLQQLLLGKCFDIVVFTGDFLDRVRSIPKLQPFIGSIRSIRPGVPMYAVLGNHDYVLKGKRLEQLITTLERLGCRVLQNEHATEYVQGRPLRLIGIDDYSTQRSHIARAYAGLPQDGFKLVLTHDPNLILDMDKYPFDYLLAGHFHGGQIHWPKPYHLGKMGTLAKMNIIRGLHMYGQRPFYISEGLGQTGVNVRYGSHPEITFHDIPLEAAGATANTKSA